MTKQKRKAISKKLRFEIFKRDLFTCQYCGATPPSVVLQVDHIKPVADGGGNEEENLIASCTDCNQGKGARLLSTAPETLAKKTELQKEKQEQLREFEKIMSLKKAAMTRKVNQLENYFGEQTDHCFADHFKKSVRMFFEKLPKHDVYKAMDISLSKHSDIETILKYFCGVCWRMIKESGGEDA